MSGRVRMALVVGGLLAGCTSDNTVVESSPTTHLAAASPARPPSSAPPTPAPDGSGATPTITTGPGVETVVPTGFTSVAATSTTASGDVCELCLWVASEPEDRSRGLMFVNDLGGADGMAFVYEEPTTTAFWMKNTPMPLSIAYYDADGRYLGGSDMAPCEADPCERYPTPIGFSTAVEVEQGTADDLGLTAGSTLVVSDLPCDPAAA